MKLGYLKVINHWKSATQPFHWFLIEELSERKHFRVIDYDHELGMH